MDWDLLMATAVCIPTIVGTNKFQAGVMTLEG